MLPSTSSPKRLVFLVAAIGVAAASLAACSAEGEVSTDDDAGFPERSSSSSSSSSSSGSSGPGTSSSSSSSSSSGSASTSGSLPDAGDGGTTKDAGDASDASTLPSVSCTKQALGGYYTRCRAAAPAISPGGTITPGSYVLAGYWDSNACGGNTLVIGSATVYQQDGKTFMRYLRTNKNSDGTVTVESSGTYWLDGAAGTLKRTELCGADVGKSEVGQYAQTGGDPDSLILKFTNDAQTWTRQP